MWTYLVSNMGNENLTNITLTDDFGTANTLDDDFDPAPVLGIGGMYNIGDTDADNELDPGETWQFTSAPVISYQVVAGQYVNAATVTAVVEGTGQVISDRDANYHFGSTVGDIRIEKAINAVDPLNPTVAEDADFATGPVLPVGASVVWTYLVTNQTSTPLANVTVIDNNGTPGDASDDFAPKLIGGDLNGNSLLDPGEVWLYSSEDIAYSVVQGQYVNVASVSATTVDDVTVMGDDRNHHLGSVGLEIEKATNAADPWDPTTAEDADQAPGRGLPVGDALVWTYLVHNSGFTSIDNIAVIDDAGTPNDDLDDFAPLPVLDEDGFNEGDLNQDHVLDPGETWLYSSAGVFDDNKVVVGEYGNIATVTGNSNGTPLTDTDASHYVGVGPEISVEKAINAVDPLAPSPFEDADIGSGFVPILTIGSTPVWTYLVTNESLVPLANVTITDDAGTPDDDLDFFVPLPVLDEDGFNEGDLNQDNVLDPGETWLYTSEGASDWVVEAGIYANNVTVTGVVPSTGEEVSDNDSNTHEGADTRIRLEKAVNAVDPANPTVAEDSDDPSTPFVIQVGDAVVWTYQVINESGQPIILGDDPITDDAGTPGFIGDDFNPQPMLGTDGFNVGDRNGNGLLDRNEVWLYTSSGNYMAVEGLYLNVAQVEAEAQDGTILKDDDVNYHLGIDPKVRVEKAINAADPTNPTAEEDADQNAVLLGVGDEIVWTYLVTNDGVNGLVIDSITDDAGTRFDDSDDFTPRAVDDGFGFNIGYRPG